MARKKNPEAVAEKKARKAPAGGKSRGKRKLTDAQVLDIVRLSAGGMTQVNLAKDFGVSTPTISSIVRGRTYGWLTGIAVAASVELAEAA
jgi:uncharacterized membrane protein